MKRRRRTGYSGREYPGADGTMDRRRFLGRAGAASALVLLAASGRARWLYAVEADGYLVVLPTTDQWREIMPSGGDSPLYYEVTIQVDSTELRDHLEDEEPALLQGFDEVLEQYAREALLEETAWEGFEDELLSLLIEEQASGDDDSAAGDDDSAMGDAHGFAEDAFLGLTLEISVMPYGDHWGSTGGCSCSSVPWRPRRRRRR